MKTMEKQKEIVVQNNVGRPTKVDKEILSKLEMVFAMGGTDQEACIYAGISPAALYRYENKNPEFRERKQELKAVTILMARKTVVDNLEHDVKVAMWYLERKKPEEFGRSSAYYSHRDEGIGSYQISEERKEKILSIMNKNRQSP